MLTPRVESAIRRATSVGEQDEITEAHLKSAQKLFIRDPEFKERDLRCLLESLPNIENLHLWDTPIGDAGLVRIAQNSPPHLSWLSLSRCGISHHGISDFSCHEPLRKLRLLSMSNDLIGRRSGERLLNGSTTTNMSMLSLRNSGLENAGLKRIAESENFARIWSLTLSFEGISDLSHLCTSSYTGNLELLTLSQNRIGWEGCQSLAACEGFRQLGQLDLAWNKIDDKDLEALGNAQFMRRLHILGLSRNLISDSGAKQIAKFPVTHHPQSLDLNGNDITDVGALALLQGQNAANYSYLTLSDTKVTDKFAFALANADYLKELSSVSLGCTKVTEIGLRAILDSPNLPKLRDISYSTDQVSTEFDDVYSRRFQR